MEINQESKQLPPPPPPAAAPLPLNNFNFGNVMSAPPPLFPPVPVPKGGPLFPVM